MMYDLTIVYNNGDIFKIDEVEGYCCLNNNQNVFSLKHNGSWQFFTNSNIRFFGETACWEVLKKNHSSYPKRVKKEGAVSDEN